MKGEMAYVELTKALKMKNEKSPGLDGFMLFFF